MDFDYYYAIMFTITMFLYQFLSLERAVYIATPQNKTPRANE